MESLQGTQSAEVGLQLQQQQQIGSGKLSRAAAKRKFTRKCNVLRDSVSQENPAAVLECNFKEVQAAYTEVETAHDRYVELLILISGISESQVENEGSYILELEKKRNEMHTLLLKTLGNQVRPSCEKKTVKVKALEPPKFDGNIRDYPSFKSDFERLMNDNYGKDPFALKQCLVGEALKVVLGVENDYDEMFKRLDEKFGNTRKVVDAVVSDLRSLKKVSEGDGKGFIRMVEKIEHCWLDLKKMKLTKEMSTTNMVSHIEKILPTTQKREWVILADKLAGSDDLFPKLMDFLLKEKRVIEYMDCCIRSSGSSDSKSVVHNVSVEANAVPCNDTLEVNNVLRNIQETQVNQSKQIHQCMVNLTDLASKININQGSSTGFDSRSNIKCWLHNTNSHDIFDCKVFQNANVSDRIDLVKNHGVCFNCLRGTHIAKNCYSKKACDRMENGQQCNRFHHPLLHQANVNGILLHNSNNMKKDKALLAVSTVMCLSQPITTLWDSGSDITIVTHEMASKLGLKGKDVNLSMTKVGNVTENYTSKEYVLPLVDKGGMLWHIHAVGINEISSNVEKVDSLIITELFKDTVDRDLIRPHGKVHLLIGTDYCKLLPSVIRVNGNMQLLENQFGFCVRGSHPSIPKSGSGTHLVHLKAHHLAGFVQIGDITVESNPSLKSSLDQFLHVESLGTQCIPRCGGCRCGKCPIGSNSYSIKEERELALIENGLHYDKGSKTWIAHYPWIQDPSTLGNNVTVAVARLKSTERRLEKLGSEYTRMYQDGLNDMIKRKVARKLSKPEVDSYNGPIHYIQHHGVLKPGSTSTPLRIVFNSSAHFMGQSLNDFWAKGPDILNGLLAVLLRFRQREVAIVGDISKMYNTVRLSEFDQHTHRFLWRNMNTMCEPDHYVLTAVPFGDRPSGTIASLALRHTADFCKAEYPEVANMINVSTYVDDILYSVDKRGEADDLIQNAEDVLSLGGFVIKHWIISGNNGGTENLKILNTDEEKILGLHWNPKEDFFCFKIRVNFSMKQKRTSKLEDLYPHNFVHKFPDILTPRMVLSQVASIYDPMGLVLPYTLTSKILMRELLMDHKSTLDGTKQKFGWDDPLPDYMKGKWKEFFYGLFELQSLRFVRCLKPSSATGDPMLIIFSDGSTQAYGTCAYVRWKLETGNFSSKLIAAKNRIAPSRQLTVPRLELCGAVLACRLRKFIQKEFDYKFSSVMHIVDSAIVRSQIQKESYGFGTFVATRVAEIQTESEPGEWWWVASENNPADLVTKPVSPNTLASRSVWQNGPKYLDQSVSEWPISQTYENNLPDRIGMMLTACTRVCVIDLSMINLKTFSNYSRLLRVTSRLLMAFKDKSLKGIFKAPDADAIEQAESLWVKEVQRDMMDWKERYKRLGPTMKDGVIFVGQRMSKWLKDNWNHDSFILLSADHPFSKLYITHVHNEDHAGIESTLAKIQSKYWIPGARRIIKSIKNKCTTCRRLTSRLEVQRMGELGPERLQPSPPFYHTALDLFGPFMIKDTVKRRTRSKAFGVIFNCLSTRTVHIDLADGYDTQSFLLVFRRFVTLRGYPHTVFSDGGTQLVAAGKYLEEMTKSWNVNDLLEFGSNKGMRWSFNKSANAPWQNGCSESLIKLIKRALTLAIGDSILTVGELQTALFEVANLLNERPIGIKPGSDPNLGTYLCPNDLVLGRASPRVPSVPVDDKENLKCRMEFVQRIVSCFWKKWQRDYFPTLIVRQKWHTQRRNVRPGDIVLMQDSNAVRGFWRMAEVSLANPGRDGIVRDVMLRYKTQKPGYEYEGQEDSEIRRSVHRLVVLLPVEER